MNRILLLAICMIIMPGVRFINAQEAAGKQSSDRLTQEIEYTLSEATKQFLFGNLNGSKFLFEKCIEADEHCAVAYFMLSGLETLNDNLELAKNYAFKAHELSKENRYYSENLANVLLLTGNKKEALEIIRSLNNTNPSIELIIRISRLEDEMGNYKKAIRILNQNNLPINEVITQELIRIHRKYDKSADSYSLLMSANTAFPENIAFAGDLALLSAGMKKYEEAERIFRNYCFTRVAPEEFLYHAVRFYLFLGKKTLADSICRLYTEALETSNERKYKRASLWTGDALIRQNYEFYLYELINQGISDGKNSMQWIRLKADNLVVNGKENEAVDLLESAIDSGLQSEELFSKLLIILNSKSDSRLEDKAGQAVKLYPEQLSFRILYGIGLMINGNYSEMVLEFEEVLNADLNKSEKTQVFVFLGEGYRKLVRMELSDAAFDSALLEDPANDLLLNNYSYYLAERSTKLEKADRMSRELMRINNENPTYLDTRGWVLFKLGKARKARKILEAAINNGGMTNWVIVEHLGDVWYNLGREGKAIECWKKVAELNGKVYNKDEQVDRVEKDLVKVKKLKL